MNYNVVHIRRGRIKIWQKFTENAQTSIFRTFRSMINHLCLRWHETTKANKNRLQKYSYNCTCPKYTQFWKYGARPHLDDPELGFGESPSLNEDHGGNPNLDHPRMGQRPKQVKIDITWYFRQKYKLKNGRNKNFNYTKYFRHHFMLTLHPHIVKHWASILLLERVGTVSAPYHNINEIPS